MTDQEQIPTRFADATLEDFTRGLAARESVPGGGAAAGSALAHAAALGSMVVAFSRGKKTFRAHEPLLEEAANRLDENRIQALRLADRDAAGFRSLAELWPLPEDDDERIARWPAAVTGAIAPPRDLVELSHDTLAILARLVGRSSRMLRSDLAIAAGFARLAADAAAWNVRMNLESFGSLPGRAEDAKALDSRITLLIDECRRSNRRIDDACHEDGRATITES